MAKKRKDCFPMIREENELLAGFWEALRRDQSAKGETQPAKRKTGSKRQGTGRAEKADPGTGAGHELKASKRKNQEGLRESARTVLAFSFGRSLFLIKHS